MDAGRSAVERHVVCSRCVMDTSAEGIEFDDVGVCDFCREYSEGAAHIVHEAPELKQRRLEALIQRVKRSGRGKRYDCVVGVSGGVDSSWALVQAVRNGLRPLAVHMDNGWNAELAQNNIANLVRTLGVDLHTHVIDWHEYRSLMKAFFDADVIDVELLYDNAMLAVNFRQAQRFGLHYILAGTNQATEGMRMPTNWNWFKYDKRNIRSLARRHGNVQMRTFPAIGTLDYIRFRFAHQVTWISLLDYLPYDKALVLDELERDFDYKRYQYKHYESVFTRFYQGYILPRKFGVDKRRLHLSTLIASGQMTRESALELLSRPPYPSAEDQEADVRFFLKKMGWSRSDLEEYLSRPSVPHDAYGSEARLWDFCANSLKRAPAALRRTAFRVDR